MPANLDGLVWLLLLLGPLLFLQRSLHREIQAVFLLVTRRPEISLTLFSLLFLPGVLMHETSHYLVARLLLVRTGRFSLVPRPMPNGHLQLGYVETAPTDWLRDGFIGGAPLLLGGAFVAYAGLAHLGLTSLWAGLVQGGPAALLQFFPALFSLPDFWLWFYLAFAVSSTMLPSASDRRAWLPLTMVVGLLLGISLLAGAGPWLMINLAGPLNHILRAVVVVMGISIFVHVVFLLPFWGLHRILSRLTGLDVV